MENNDVEFKIKKINRYEENLEEEKKEIVKRTALLGVSTLAAVSIFAVAQQYSNDSYVYAKDIILGLANTGFSIYNIKGLIESISKKVVINREISDLTEEIDGLNNEEGWGMKR